MMKIITTTLNENAPTWSSATRRCGSPRLLPQGNRKPVSERYGTCQAPRKSDVVSPATTTVSRKSAIANMPNFIPLYSTK